MKHASQLLADEIAILNCFADFDNQGGIDELCRYIMHCGIQIPEGMRTGDAILAHYRNPLGYDIDRADMDLRTWPPIAARLLELQTAEAERRATATTKRVRAHRSKRVNGHAAALPAI
jgi:hypothetical protein